MWLLLLCKRGVIGYVERTPVLLILTFEIDDNPPEQPNSIGDIAVLSRDSLREETLLASLHGHGHNADLENWFQIRLELLAAGGEAKSCEEESDI